MQVLLIQDVDTLGKRGETKNVTEGYARNFLLPRSMAVFATDGALRNAKLLSVSWTRKSTQEKERAQELAKRIEGVTLKITKRAGDKGRLFGSVTSADIVDLLNKEAKTEIDKKAILTDHIKELGEHLVSLRLAPEVKTTFKVIILPEEAAATV